MKSLADALPPEIALQIHPDLRRNEAAYWATRDQLLSQNQDQWIAIADGAVIVTAATPLEVFVAVKQLGGHPFVCRVGHEQEPWYRIRRTSFSYDPCQLQADFAAQERILGRDVLNRIEVLFRGPTGEVIVNP
jgi:hypothetical protein